MLSATLLLAAACSNDGRELADPDPDLTAGPVPTTAAPTATGDAALGVDARELALPSSQVGPEGLTLESPAFTGGAVLPVTYTCDGEDVSPPLSWRQIPVGAAELALVVRDAEADGRIIWLVSGMTAGSVGFSEGEVTDEAVVHRNDEGRRRWSAPCPDDDVEHRYVFALHALTTALDVTGGAPTAEVVAAIDAVDLGAATVLGKYGAPAE